MRFCVGGGGGEGSAPLAHHHERLLQLGPLLRDDEEESHLHDEIWVGAEMFLHTDECAPRRMCCGGFKKTCE